VNLTSQFIRTKNLADTSAYAVVGIGLMDSFISIWNAKYYFNLLRPETYIRQYIDPTFIPHIVTPEFPEYVSGHSGVSATSAVLMAAVLGDGPFVDRTKLRRGFGPRSFPNFFAAAQEAANSRLYGGIHYPLGNSIGLSLGQCVASKVLARVSLH
jgi:membrane-associated phospholipid phosphatase